MCPQNKCPNHLLILFQFKLFKGKSLDFVTGISVTGVTFRFGELL